MKKAHKQARELSIPIELHKTGPMGDRLRNTRPQDSSNHSTVAHPGTNRRPKARSLRLPGRPGHQDRHLVCDRHHVSVAHPVLARAIRDVLRHGNVFPGVQDLLGEQQGSQTRAVWTLDLLDVSGELAGVARPTKLSVLSMRDQDFRAGGD